MRYQRIINEVSCGQIHRDTFFFFKNTDKKVLYQQGGIQIAKNNFKEANMNLIHSHTV